jgi:hypothetical protein
LPSIRQPKKLLKAEDAILERTLKSVYPIGRLRSKSWRTWLAGESTGRGRSSRKDRSLHLAGGRPAEKARFFEMIFSRSNELAPSIRVMGMDPNACFWPRSSETGVIRPFEFHSQNIGGGAFCLSDRSIIFTSIDHMSLVQFLVTLEIGLGVIRHRLGASEIRFCLARAGLRHILLRPSGRDDHRRGQ